jgi:GPH family glycoside/pentoside/hexuronide:cation symporter
MRSLEKMAEATPRIPALRKLAYGVGNVAYSLPYQATATFFLFFATVILKIPPALAGTVLAVSAVWDAVTDPLVGYLSDNTENGRLGRRHPYLIVGGVSVAALTLVLWAIPPGWDAIWRGVAVFCALILLKTALTVFYVPYLALGGELSSDYDERSSIQGFRAAFYLAGMMTAIAGATLVFFRPTPGFARGQLNPAAYPRMALAFAVLVLLATWVSVAGTRRYIPSLPQRTEQMRRRGVSAGHLLTDLARAMRRQELRTLVLMIFVIEAGFQFGIAIGIHVNTFTYGLSGPQIGLLALIVLGTSVLSQPLWVALSKRFEKRTALIAGLLIGFAGFVGAPWAHVWWKLFPIDPRTLVWTLGLFMIPAGLGNGAFLSIPNAMIADAADLEELESGQREEGLYFGTYTLAYKLGTSLSLVASGFALGWIGFDPASATQSEATRFQLAMVPTYLLIATAPFALLFLSRYRITRARAKEIREALAAARLSLSK